MIGILKSYLKKLTNLTSNNRAIYMPRLAADSGIDLLELNYAVNKSAFELLQDLIVGKKEVKICKFLDSRDKSANELSKKLNKIFRKDRLITEERGAKDLYVGYPFVHGTFPEGIPVRCPLVLFPVDIEIQDGSDMYWKLVKKKDTLPILNKSFLLAYSHFNHVKIDDTWLDFQFEDTFEDALSFKNYLYKLLKESPLEINFNSDIFTDTLIHFEPLKKEDLFAQNGAGQLKLYAEAVIGIFPQAGSLLSGDYEELIETASFDDFDQLFESKFIENPNASRITKEENMLLPFAIDASQELAIMRIKSGNSMVIQGPPGTGKSQVICNLASDFIARGKKVLIVCQKRAALDVVYERLSTIGIQDFVGLVHDFRFDQKKLYDQLATQIDQIEAYQQTNNSLDSIWLEREFLKISRHIDAICEELDSFKCALFDESMFGISVKALYLSCHAYQQSIDLTHIGKSYNVNSLGDLLAKFERLLTYYHLIDNQKSPTLTLPEGEGTHRTLLNNRKSFAHLQASDLKIICAMLEEIFPKTKLIENSVRQHTNIELSFNDLLVLYQSKDKLKELNLILSEVAIASLFEQCVKIPIAGITKIKTQIKSIGKSISQPIETTLAADELLVIGNKIENAITHFERIDKKIYWLIFSKDKKQIDNLLNNNALKSNLPDLKLLFQRVSNRQKLEKQLDDLQKYFTNDLGIDRKDIAEISSLISQIELVLNGLVLFNDLNLIIKKPLSPLERGWGEAFKIYELQKIVESTNEVYLNWQKYLSTQQITDIIQNELLSQEIINSIKLHFDTLVAYDLQIERLLPQERRIFNQIIISPTLTLPEGEGTDRTLVFRDALNLCKTSFYLSWIEEIEIRHPILKSVSTPKIAQLEIELQQLVAQKKKLSQEIVRIKAREKTYKNIEFNRLNNRITYRDLYHQATKKKKIWKLRKTIHDFGHELFDLVPCWLASPETVSAIFPLQEIFDLVIFDEASQCFAEKGLPSIVRGKQVVIVGDSKQLPPNDLYLPRWEDEHEEDIYPELEIDSLLNLSEKYLPQAMLMGHYRSHSPELIGFSNTHFYKQKLQILPHVSHIINKKPAIEFIKTLGVWEHNSNVIEAEAVVAKAIFLIKSQPEKSLGIVTFNIKQQELISDILESELLSLNMHKPDKLFVKNIENVQGDERDIMLFSIGYAPDLQGRMQMQFGSLNQAGGENRLNVAITRACEKIIVISSILPHQLKIEESKNEGPKLLKAYLEYVIEVAEGTYVFPEIISDNYLPKIYLKHKFPNYSLHQLPFADIVESTDNETYKLVFTDDDLYYKALSAKETFAYTPASLSSKGWKYERLFSRNYWLSNNL